MSTNSYDIVIIYRVFDTVRHPTLLQKLAQLDILDHIYNWMTDFFRNHVHCTSFRGQQSSLLSIAVDIILGYAIGPAAYVVNVSK